MSQQIQKGKGRKSYEELKNEFLNAKRIIGVNYIPLMCEALRDENPEWENSKIETKIYADLSGEFVETYIRDKLPSWIHDQAKVRNAMKAWETKTANQRKSIIKKITELGRTELPRTKLPEEQSTTFDDMQDEDLGLSELNEIGGTGESALALYAKINGPARELFKALTQKEMPHLVDDVVLDFIKPSREYRTSIFHEVDRNMQVSLYNALVWTRDAIDDTLNILDKITKQEKK